MFGFLIKGSFAAYRHRLTARRGDNRVVDGTESAQSTINPAQSFRYFLAAGTRLAGLGYAMFGFWLKGMQN